MSKSEVNILRKDIIAYLNEKAGRRYVADSDVAKQFIDPRLKEGRAVEEFKKIIDLKVAKWGGDPKMDDFLRPSTLFRKSHFDEYLNEKPTATLKKARGSGVDLDAWAKQRDREEGKA